MPYRSPFRETGEASVGEDEDILPHAEADESVGRHHHLAHSRRAARPLVAYHDDVALLDLARYDGGVRLLVGVEYARRSGEFPRLLRNRRRTANRSVRRKVTAYHDYDAVFALVESEEARAMFSPRTEEQRELGRVLVLSDSAHSIGAEYKGRKAGSLADVSVFSFHAVKNLTTAEGGAIMLNLPEPFDNEEVYRYLCTFTLHGQNKDALAKTKKGAWRYDVLVSGFKGNMTDIQASIGLVELRRYEEDTLVYRKHIFNRYEEAFKKYEWAELPLYETAERRSSFHVYCLRVKGVTEEQRDDIIQRIFDRDVAVNVHFQPLPLLTAFKEKGYRMEDYPVAYDNYSREISLPVWYGLNDDMVDEVVRAVVDSVEEILDNHK